MARGTPRKTPSRTTRGTRRSGSSRGKSSKTPRAGRTRTFSLRSFVAGAVCGAATGALFHGYWNWPPDVPFVAPLAEWALTEGDASENPQTSSSAAADAERQTPLTYEFIDRLPREEVVTGADAYRPPPAAESDDREYLLQAASFRSRDDADALRAELILEGLDVKINAVPRTGDGTWHRVLVGPFASRTDMERTLGKLRARDISALVLELVPTT